MADEAAVVEAPPAPATTPAAVSSPAKPQQREIQVSQMPPPAKPAEPPKKGSARESVLADLRKRAKPEPGTAPEPEPVKPVVKDLEDGDEPPESAGKSDSDAPPVEPKAGADGKKPKVNPWKLYEEAKKKIQEYEGKIAEVEKRAIPEDKWKSTQETLAQKEARLKELEEEIRYVNYSKSDEFKQKYQVPYDAAWKRAMSELKELAIETGEGQTRPMEPADILSLVNKSLPEARKEAVEKFGDFAEDVMAHRKEIRRLFDEQSAALEQAKLDGESREKQKTEAAQKEMGELGGVVKDQWAKANEAAQADEKYGTYFKPIEGDEQGNQRLAKGFELADRAFSENPFAKGLTTEQRNAIVQRHAAVRNRCAAFGRLVFQNQSKDAEIAELKKQLAEFSGVEPPADGGNKQPAQPVKTGGMTGVLAELRKRAK